MTKTVSVESVSKPEKSLPSGWRWIWLGDVCQVVTGSTPPRSESRFYGGTIPWIKPADLDQAMWVEKSMEYLTEAGGEVSRLLPQGSVLVSCIGNLGKVAIAARKLATNQQINALIPGPEIDSVFLFFVCKTLRTTMDISASATIIPIINKKTFSDLLIVLPPLSEQKRIVRILSEQMATIGTARAATKAQSESAQALPAAYLRSVFNSPEAKKWPKKALGAICQQDRHIVAPDSHEATKLPYISLEHIESNSGRILKEFSQIEREEGISTTFAFDGRHVLYGKLRPYLNKVALPKFAGRCTTEIIPLLPSDSIDRIFLAWTLRQKEIIDAAMQEKTGSRMPRANMNHILSLKVPLPPLSEQKRITMMLAEQISSAEKVINQLQEQLETINKMTPALLRLAFEGKL